MAITSAVSGHVFLISILHYILFVIGLPCSVFSIHIGLHKQRGKHVYNRVFSSW